MGTSSLRSEAPTVNTLGLEEGEKKHASLAELPADTKTGILCSFTAFVKISSISLDLGPLSDKLIKVLPGTATSITCVIPLIKCAVVPSPDLSSILTE